MIYVISPAKALDFDKPPHIKRHTQPELLEASASLISLLRDYSPAQVAELMRLSDKLASLNAARFEAWAPPFSPDNAKQAVLAFNGDVYEGLDAASLTENDLDWAQDHLRILSGLYGVLRPLDLMQAYRLEMGTRLPNPSGKNLYEFWGARITETLNQALQAETSENQQQAVLVNLASDEYFKSVKPAKLKARIITPVFEDWKTGKYKIISFYAKRARGLMCRFAIQRRITEPAGLKSFDLDGYRYDEGASNEQRLVYRRKQA